jgi:hypothetical protein
MMTEDLEGPGAVGEVAGNLAGGASLDEVGAQRLVLALLLLGRGRGQEEVLATARTRRSTLLDGSAGGFHAVT